MHASLAQASQQPQWCNRLRGGARGIQTAVPELTRRKLAQAQPTEGKHKPAPRDCGVLLASRWSLPERRAARKACCGVIARSFRVFHPQIRNVFTVYRRSRETSAGRRCRGGARRTELIAMAAMAATPDSEMDITSLLQPRQGYLWKLGGGQEKGSKWNRRWCVFAARTPAGLLRVRARREAPARAEEAHRRPPCPPGSSCATTSSCTSTLPRTSRASATSPRCAPAPRRRPRGGPEAAARRLPAHRDPSPGSRWPP